MRSFERIHIEQVIAMVRKDLGADHRPGILCGKVYMGETKFKKLFKDFTGHSFHEWLVEERMQHAILLLQEPHYTLKQIGKKTGYAYTRNFGKAFKKRWNISPGLWRKERGIEWDM